MTPEVIYENNYDFIADIYSLGVIFEQMPVIHVTEWRNRG